jgi:hypothetical protein
LDRPPRPPSLPSHRRPTGRYPPPPRPLPEPSHRRPSSPIALREPSRHPGNRDSGRPPRSRRSTGEHKYLPPNRLFPAINSLLPSSPHDQTITAPPLPHCTATSSHHREPITTIVSSRGAASTSNPNPT